jgi:eukaryotic-like serine/threonine-protein kinase
MLRAMSRREQELIGGKYRLLRPLATGGMGAIWVAHHVDLAVDVAVKFHSPRAEFDSHAEQRFRREAQAAAKLKSPHVVQMYDFGIDAGAPYIVMELLEGEDLGEHLERERRLDFKVSLDLLRQAAKALTLAHQAGIVHRDIKPSNLFLARIGGERLLKVLDFGIAKHIGTQSGEATTAVGVVLGSPAYMSPEQARGGALDYRSDLWSLSAVLYRMLTGRPPFAGHTSQDIVIKVCTEAITPPSQLVTTLPAALDGFFIRALARRPEDRFQSADELVRAFEAVAPSIPASAAASADAYPSAGRTSATEPLSALTLPAKPAAFRRWARYVTGAGLLAAVFLFWRMYPKEHATHSAESAAAAANTSQQDDSSVEPALSPAHTAPEQALLSDSGHADSDTERVQAEPAPQNRLPSIAGASRSPRQAKPSRRLRNQHPETTAPTDPVFGLPLQRSEERTD